MPGELTSQASGKLLIRPTALEDETPCSLLIRAAAKNGWDIFSLVAAFFGFYGDSSVRAISNRGEPLKACGQEIGISEEDLSVVCYQRASRLKGAGFVWNGLSVPFDSMRTKWAAVCTECLSADAVPYARKLWDHKFVRSCAVHKRLLCTSCPNCVKQLTQLRTSIVICPCGYDLREHRSSLVEVESELILAAVTTKDSNLLEAATQLATSLEAVAIAQSRLVANPSALACAVIANPSTLPSILNDGTGTELMSTRIALRRLLPTISDSRVSRLFEACNAAHVFAVRGEWGSTLEGTVSGDEAKSLLGATDRILRRIDEAGALVQARSGSKKRTREYPISSINRLLIKLAIAEKNQCRPSRPLQGINVAKAMANLATGVYESNGYSLTEGIKSLLLIVPVEIRPTESNLLTIGELASKAGVHYESIRFLIKNRFLTAIQPQSCKKPWLIEGGVAATFLSEFVFAGPLARSVGAGVTSFAEKLQARKVIPVSGPTIDGGLSYLFRRTDISALDLNEVATTRGYATRTGRKKKMPARTEPDKTSYSFSEAAKLLDVSVQLIRRLVSNKELAQVISLDREKSVTADSLNALLAMKSNSDVIEYSEANIALRETRGAFRRRWIATGFASAIKIGGSYYISREDFESIKSLKATHIEGANISQLNGLNRGHLNNQVKINSSVTALKVGKSRLTLNMFDKDMVIKEIEAANQEASGPRPTLKTPVTNFKRWRPRHKRAA